jgi:hypothetical protein
MSALAFAAALVTVLAAGMRVTDRAHATQPQRSPQLRESAVAFLELTIRLLAANEYATAWSSLDRSQQRLVSRDAYVRCESASPIPGRVARVDLVRVGRQHIVVPGSGRRPQLSSAATFRVVFEPMFGGAPVVVRVTAHALRHDDEWRWMLSARRLALHRSGDCGVRPTIGDPSP